MSTGRGGRLFPLQPLSLPRPSSSPSPRVRARYKRTLGIIMLTNLLVAALNCLSLGGPSSAPLHVFLDVDSGTNAIQSRVHEFLFDCVSVFVSRRRDVSCQSGEVFSFCDLPSTSLFSFFSSFLPSSSSSSFFPMDPYFLLFHSFSSELMHHSYSALSDVMPLVASKVSLPISTKSIPLLSVLPPDVASLYASPDALLVDPSEVDLSDLPSPRMCGSVAQYELLVTRLNKAGMVTFSSAPRVVNGLFVVKKDGDKQRLIIDARFANKYFRKPATVSLPTPHHLSRILMANDSPLFVAKSDLQDYYHNLALPDWLHPFFALPPVRACVAGLGSNGLVYPCCTTVPMGWAHSVFIAQSVHQYVLSSTLGSVSSWSLCGDVLCDAAVDAYIDDLSILGHSEERVADLQNKAFNAYATFGFPVKDSKTLCATCLPTEVLGLELDGTMKRLAPSLESALSLVGDTLHVLSLPAVHGRVVEHLVGRWTWVMLVRRPILCVFKSVYWFVKKAENKPLSLWSSVKTELMLAIGLVPLLFAPLAAPFFPEVLATDACSYGAGVCVAEVSLVAQLSLYKNWRFLQTDASHLIGEWSWKPLFHHRFREEAHINVLELEAVLLGVKWCLSHGHSIGTRLLLFSDSKVAVAILAKGRSSGASVVTTLRRLHAHLLASGLLLSPFWISTDVNPADELSRR